ncbi:hypothetical protein RB195_013991 [Necator americanus]|uniref:Endonuclease/exonuclease/phosphatase domain-containing protein n=1 Tax=Necator americanus TaxID=51031 RepID=A0ABR1DY57_NECAM
MRICGSTPALTIFVVYAPTSSYNEEEVEAFYMNLEKFYREDDTFYKVIICDFNVKIGPRRTPGEFHIGTHGFQWNGPGERLSEFMMPTKTIHGNSQFQKPSSTRWMWESPNGDIMKFTTSSSVKVFLTVVAVVPKFYTGSDHRLIRGRFSFTRKGGKTAKFEKRSSRSIIDCKLFASLVGFWKDTDMGNIDEYERLVEHLRYCNRRGKRRVSNHQETPVSKNSRGDTSAWSYTSCRQPRTHV